MDSCKDKDPINILLIGKLEDKFATSNSVLQTKSSGYLDCCRALRCSIERNVSTFKGREIHLVQTAGLRNVSLNNKHDIKFSVNEMLDAMTKNPKGYHAFVYIARYENQLSAEDVHAVTFFKQVFGSDFMRCHGIILLFTNGNSCDTNAEKIKENFKLEVWLKKENQSNIKSLIKECGSRIMLFNKRCKGENPNQSLMERLIQMIDGLTNEGNKYTIDKFQKAQKETEKLIGDVKRPHLKGELYIKMCRITKELNDIRLVSLREDQVLRGLLNLKSEAELIFAELEEEDNETSALCVAMKILNTLLKSIKEKLSLFSSLQSL